MIVARVHNARPDVHVLIVDDGSPDGTGELADELALDDPDRVHVMHRTAKDGLGAAYLAGFAWGLSREYSVLVEMDADGSHPPSSSTGCSTRSTAGADLVIGSRYVAGGEVRNWPRRRMVLSRTANGYSRILLGVDVHDITAGYRAYRREVLEKIDLAAVDSKGYCFQIDLTWRTINNGFVVVEVPITFTEREFGQSKMSGSNIREALFKVAEWGVRGRLDRARGVGPLHRASSAAAAAAAGLDDVEALLEQLVELLDRAALQQHVPVGARRLDLLRLRHVTLDQGALHAVAAQPGAGDLGVVGERNVELLAVVGAVAGDLTRRQVVVAVRLVAHGSEATASQDTISHRQHSSIRNWSGLSTQQPGAQFPTRPSMIPGSERLAVYSRLVHRDSTSSSPSPVAGAVAKSPTRAGPAPAVLQAVLPAARLRAARDGQGHRRSRRTAVVLTAEEAPELSDRVYQVRCAAEDVATAVDEGAAAPSCGSCATR